MYSIQHGSPDKPHQRLTSSSCGNHPTQQVDAAGRRQRWSSQEHRRNGEARAPGYIGSNSTPRRRRMRMGPPDRSAGGQTRIVINYSPGPDSVSTVMRKRIVPLDESAEYFRDLAPAQPPPPFNFNSVPFDDSRPTKDKRQCDQQDAHRCNKKEPFPPGQFSEDKRGQGTAQPRSRCTNLESPPKALPSAPIPPEGHRCHRVSAAQDCKQSERASKSRRGSGPEAALFMETLQLDPQPSVEKSRTSRQGKRSLCSSSKSFPVFKETRQRSKGRVSFEKVITLESEAKAEPAIQLNRQEAITIVGKKTVKCEKHATDSRKRQQHDEGFEEKQLHARQGEPECPPEGSNFEDQLQEAEPNRMVKQSGGKQQRSNWQQQREPRQKQSEVEGTERNTREEQHQPECEESQSEEEQQQRGGHVLAEQESPQSDGSPSEEQHQNDEHICGEHQQLEVGVSQGETELRQSSGRIYEEQQPQQQNTGPICKEQKRPERRDSHRSGEQLKSAKKIPEVQRQQEGRDSRLSGEQRRSGEHIPVVQKQQERRDNDRSLEQCKSGENSPESGSQLELEIPRGVEQRNGADYTSDAQRQPERRESYRSGEHGWGVQTQTEMADAKRGGEQVRCGRQSSRGQQSTERANSRRREGGETLPGNERLIYAVGQQLESDEHQSVGKPVQTAATQTDGPCAAGQQKATERHSCYGEEGQQGPSARHTCGDQQQPRMQQDDCGSSAKTQQQAGDFKCGARQQSTSSPCGTDQSPVSECPEQQQQQEPPIPESCQEALRQDAERRKRRESASRAWLATMQQMTSKQAKVPVTKSTGVAGAESQATPMPNSAGACHCCSQHGKNSDTEQSQAKQDCEPSGKYSEEAGVDWVRQGHLIVKMRNGQPSDTKVVSRDVKFGSIYLEVKPETMSETEPVEMLDVGVGVQACASEKDSSESLEKTETVEDTGDPLLLKKKKCCC